MSKKGKSDFPIPGRGEWQQMFAGASKNDKRYYKPNKDGWSKVFGDIDLVSAKADSNKVKAESTRKNYLARFLSPMSGVMQISNTDIKPGQRFEVGYHVSTTSSAGFLATTVTFLNSSGAPVGLPSSSGVKLNTLHTEALTPVSFVTSPAPEGAVKAQLAFVVFGMELDKFADIDKVSFREIS